MAQINKGTTYSTTNPTVTVTNLNAHVDNATLLPGSISDQVDLAANVDPSSLQISVLSSGLLKKATVLQALGGINPSTLLAKSSNLSDLANAATARTNLALGNVEDKSSATIRSEITSANLTSLSSSNVTTALGYIPLSTASTVLAANILPGITSAQINSLSITQVSNLGSGVSDFLQAPSSSNLRAALTDETGTGAAVFESDPSLIRPTLALPFIGGYTEANFTISSAGASQVLDLASYTIFIVTLTSGTPCTFTMPTGASAVAGKSFSIYLRQPSTGTFTAATFTNVRWTNGITPTITAQLGKMDILSFISDGVRWYGSLIQNFTY